jgi:UrcA family protein
LQPHVRRRSAWLNDPSGTANAAHPAAEQSRCLNRKHREHPMNRPTRPFPAFLVTPALFVAGTIATATAVSAEKSFHLAAWGEARSATVRYADLDLGTPDGAMRLERRIAFAVDQVCALPHAEQLGQRARVAACRAEALSQAEARAAQLVRKAGAVARRD